MPETQKVHPLNHLRSDLAARFPERKDVINGALGAAGVVDGYRYTCRRKGCGFVEVRPAAGDSRCPKCQMRLWVSPIPKPLRFYDLRHSYGTLLRKAKVDLGAVQKNLGHATPEITAKVYDHSGIEDFRDDVERVLTFGVAEPINATSMQSVADLKDEAPDASAFTGNDGGFELSGRLDLNQRPLAPQRRSLSVQAVVRGRKTSQRLAMARTGSPRFRHISPDFAELSLLVCCWDSGPRVEC